MLVRITKIQKKWINGIFSPQIFLLFYFFTNNRQNQKNIM